MKIAVFDHQEKAMGIANAILDAGHDLCQEGAELLLVDHDSTPFYMRLLDRFPNVPIVIYPHGGMSYICWDGIWPVNERTVAMLALSKGAAQITRGYGYPLPVHVIGWPWGNLWPFQPLNRGVRTVLFAPIHQLNNGFMYEEARKANAEMFARLLKLPVQLRVRTFGKPEECGLWEAEGVKYIEADERIGMAGIHTADVVVSRDTFAYAAVARGQPTVMFGQYLHQWDGHSAEAVGLAKHWNDYKDELHFPLDADDDDLMATIERAARTDEPIRVWRERFIGEAMDGPAMVRILENIVAVRQSVL